MEEFLHYLLEVETVGLYVAAWCFVCAVFVAIAPVSLTERIPNWLMIIINVCAVNIGHAANKLTDIKGNPQGVNDVGISTSTDKAA